MLAGYFLVSQDELWSAQKAAVAHAKTNLPALRGKNLACWCPLTASCHAHTLLECANA